MIQKSKEILEFEELWKDVSKILNLINMMPDKASLDYDQLLKLHLELKNSDNAFKDLIQALILKKELAILSLQKIVN
jgi:hypothetical protein